MAHAIVIGPLELSVLGAVEPRRKLRALQLRRRRRGAAENTRQTIERLYAIVEEQQQQQIDRLLETIMRYEIDSEPDPARNRAKPAIR